MGGIQGPVPLPGDSSYHLTQESVMNLGLIKILIPI